MASAPGVSRSQRTPLARSMIFRPSARCTMAGACRRGPPEAAPSATSAGGVSTEDKAAGDATEPDPAAPDRDACSAPNSRWSSELPSSLASEYSTPTDGTETPRSICEIRLAEHPIRRASSRTDSCRSSRARRSRGPSPVPGLKSPGMPSHHDVNVHCTFSGQTLTVPLHAALDCDATRQGAAMAVPSLPLAPAPGRMNVDFEERIDFGRLRQYRLDRARQAMEHAGLGALLVFDNNNIRYLTGVAIGEWTRDKMCRYALYTRTGELVLWDFGSAAVHHRMYCPWLKPENCIASYTTMRGAAPPGSGLTQKQVAEIKDRLQSAGITNEPIGVDWAEVPTFFELQKQGLDIRDGQQVMLDAREIKSRDEITLLSTAAALVDGTYQDIAAALKPGVRENEIVALANKRLYEMGSDDVESINAVSGERCNPHPHNFSDRMIRPGEQAFFDIMHSYNGYRTCYYRCFAVGWATEPQKDAYKRAREWIDVAIDMIKPGVSTDQIARLWPTAEEIGLADEKTAFGLEFGHGLGLALHERPIISRLTSLDAPLEIKEGMVFALETYCPATDGRSAARIEEEVVVGPSGVDILTKFPAQDLYVTNPY